MTKEIEQAAKAAGKKYRETHLLQYNSRYQEHGENDFAKGFEQGATSPEAAAYHGQGWVSVEEMGNFAEWVRCNYIKVAQGYMYRLASIGSSATKYFQMSDLIKMYLMKPLPSPLNEKK